jgi:streptogramin lyase
VTYEMVHQIHEPMKRRICALAGMMIGLVLTISQGLTQSAYTPYTFTTLAGNTGYGSMDGTGSHARFWNPHGVAVDSSGNVYVADTENHTIRKVAPAGEVSTLAGLAGYESRGSADGTGNNARFNGPHGIAVDSAGNLYVADSGNNTIRKVTPAGAVTTLAGTPHVVGSFDGTGSAAFFNYPTGMAVDSAGNVYVADSGNNTIRKVTSTGVVTTLAGAPQFDNNGVPVGGSADGTGSAARFNVPFGVAVDSTGNVYVADTENHTIRKVTPAGVVTTFAGLARSSGSADGIGNDARFFSPHGVAVDSAGNVYVADTGNLTIRKVTPAGVVTTLAGLVHSGGSADGTGDAARFGSIYGDGPLGVAVDHSGNVYVADTFNNTIRKVTPAALVTTLAGLAGGSGSADGTASAARFRAPHGVAVDSAGNVYVADTENDTIRKVTPTGVVTTLAGLAQRNANGDPVGGSEDGTGSDARFWNPFGVAVDSAGNVYVADFLNNTIRKVTPAGVVTTLAGLAQLDANGNPVHASTDGTGNGARFWYPGGVAVDGAGNAYVADTFNFTIRKVTPAGVVTTLAGQAGSVGSADGTGSDARFGGENIFLHQGPSGVAVDSAGNVYVADFGNHTIRKVTPAGVVTTLAGLAGSPGAADGTGSVARFWYPSGVAVDSAGDVYVADSGYNTIRKVTRAGVVTTLAGLAGIAFSADGTGSAARFSSPFSVAVDSAGNVYVADTRNHTIRKGSPVPIGFLLFGPRVGFDDGQFGFFLAGQAGQSVVLEASADLTSWLPVWTNTFAGVLNFVDPQSRVYSNRFYRAFMQ